MKTEQMSIPFDRLADSKRSHIVIKQGKISVFIVPEKKMDNHLAGEYMDALTQKEKDFIPYFKFEHARKQYIIHRAVLRILLGNILNKKPQDVSIAQHAKGKPYTHDDSSLFFNVSNTKHLSVYAFSRESEIGIDIEAIRTLDQLDSMVQTNFTRAEAEWVFAKDREQHKRFFQLWTVKEAYLKAIGEGMRLLPRHIEFEAGPDSFKFISADGLFEAENWQVYSFTPYKGYTGALIYQGKNTCIQFVRIM